MLNKHPEAQLLRTLGDPPVDIRYGTQQYIQCSAVTPEPDQTLPIFTNPGVPIAVRTYYEHRYFSLLQSRAPDRRSLLSAIAVLSTCSPVHVRSSRSKEMASRKHGSRRYSSPRKNRSPPCFGAQKSSTSMPKSSRPSRTLFMILRRRQRSWLPLTPDTQSLRRHPTIRQQILCR